VLLLGESVPSNLALGLVLVMAGVAAMTVQATKCGGRCSGCEGGCE